MTERTRTVIICLVLGIPGVSAVVFSDTLDPELPLNEIQVIGTHNSYHLAPPEWIREIVGRVRPDEASAWDYSHPPLSVQLSQGIRQFELDLFLDPEGGQYADPLVHRLARLVNRDLAPFDADGIMSRPGTKVLHVPDVGYWSNTPTLRTALQEMLTWSLENPGHLPLMVLIECKEEHHPPLPTQPLQFTRERLLELEEEILEVIPREKILFPDDIRAEEATLREAVLRHGWPRLEDLQGRFLFTLDNSGSVAARYLEGNPSLEGRLMFVSAPDTDHPAAAWFKRNDPVRQFDEIRDLVASGFLVRTRSDSGSPDPKRRERAFDSGAQWISTDYYSHRLKNDRRVRFEDNALVRKNPVGTTVSD